MQQLEEKIAAWRARVSAALPGQEETVRELEEHLRDHIEAQGRYGVSASEAFDDGIAKIGELRVLAREFERVATPWYGLWPMAVIYGLVGVPILALLALMLWQYGKGTRSLLMGTHVVTIFSGYVAMFGAGLVGLWTIFSGWQRPSTDREIQTQRRGLFQLTLAGSVLVPLGMVLGMLWYGTTHAGVVWSWEPVEVGALSVLISTWLLLAVQLRVIGNDRVRAMLALLGSTVVGIGWFGANALTAPLPIAWMCGAAIFAQGAVALLQVRAKRETARAKIACES